MIQIYAGNLPSEYTDEELRKLFEPYGTVAAATIGRDKKTEKSLGYGFVQMPVKAEARAAIEALRGKKLGKEPMLVRALKPGDEFHQHALATHKGSQPGGKLTGKLFSGNVVTRASSAVRRSGKRGG